MLMRFRTSTSRC